MKRILIVGTADTKGAALAFLGTVVAASGASPVLVDVGTRRCPIAVGIGAADVARAHPDGPDAVLGGDDRGASVSAMTEAFRRFVATCGEFDGILGIGGMGVTTGGAIGARSGKSLDACAAEIDAIAAAAHSKRDDVIVLCHGGPIASPADAEYVLRRVDRCHRFYRASSMERLPAEEAVTRQTAAFKAITFGGGNGGNANRDRPRHDNVLHPDDMRPFGFDWGQIALTVGPEVNGARNFSGGVVTLPPAQGHTRHHHLEAEEIIFVVSGHGEQMVEDEAGRPISRSVGPGCTIYVPQGRFHGTENTGAEPMVLFVVYSPTGPEAGLRRLPDFRLL